MPSGDDQRAPAQLGPYEVLLPLASGGMGTVYLGRLRTEGGHGPLVAIKVMHVHLREDPQFATELLGEAKLASMIHHPNVVSVLHADQDRDGIFLVMDYVEGDSLSGLWHMLRDRGEVLPERIGLRVLVDALRGLHAAHELRDEGEVVGLVHRDFTPQNILVGVDGHSRLTDFGVAKAANRTSYTATGLIKGKLHYMPPEQARSDPLDRRSDVWSAGVILWELLARRRMYIDRSDTAVLLQLVMEEPERLKDVRPDVSDAFDEVCRWALTREPEDRCPSAEVLADAIVAAAEEGDGLASEEEVGTFVRGLVGETIAERRAKVGQEAERRASDAPGAEAPGPVAPKASATRSGAHSPVAEPTTFEPTNASKLPEAPSRPSRWRPILGVAAGALLVVGAMESYRAFSEAPAAPEIAEREGAIDGGDAAGSDVRGDDPAAVVQGAASGEAPAQATSSSPAPSGEEAGADAPAGPRTVAVVADVPMVSVWLGARRLTFAKAIERVDLVLNAEENDVDEIVVQARDGRRVKVSLGDGPEVKVTFAGVPYPSRGTPTPPSSRYPQTP